MQRERRSGAAEHVPAYPDEIDGCSQFASTAYENINTRRIRKMSLCARQREEFHYGKNMCARREKQIKKRSNVILIDVGLCAAIETRADVCPMYSSSVHDKPVQGNAAEKEQSHSIGAVMNDLSLLITRSSGNNCPIDTITQRPVALDRTSATRTRSS